MLWERITLSYAIVYDVDVSTLYQFEIPSPLSLSSYFHDTSEYVCYIIEQHQVQCFGDSSRAPWPRDVVQGQLYEDVYGLAFSD